MRAQIRRLTLALSALAILVLAPGLGAQQSEECQFCVEDCPTPFNLQAFCEMYCDTDGEPPEFSAAECDDNQPGCQNPGDAVVACYGFM